VTALKGRGSASQTAHRFEKVQRCTADDGWGTLDEEVAQRTVPLTEVIF
jgi:hypothetical protein